MVPRCAPSYQISNDKSVFRHPAVVIAGEFRLNPILEVRDRQLGRDDKCLPKQFRDCYFAPAGVLLKFGDDRRGVSHCSILTASERMAKVWGRQIGKSTIR